MNGERNIISDLLHIGLLAVLLAVLVFAAMYIGILKCGILPGLCDVYFGTLNFFEGGVPRVLIVEGTDGMGDGRLLEQLLEDRGLVGIQADRQQLGLVSAGNLRDYDMVVVTHARTMDTDKLRIFLDYALNGGRLVWTGDAGTGLTNRDQPLYEHEREGKPTCEDILDANPNADLEDTECVFEVNARLINPWARVDDQNRIINFDQLVGVEYITDFCSLRNCGEEDPFVGELVTEPGGDHPLVSGIRPDLAFYGNFAVVEDASDAFATRVLSVEYAGFLPLEDEEATGRHLLPIIVTSGLGGRVAYYAIPVEYFLKPGSRLQSPTLLENMYYGMIEG